MCTAKHCFVFINIIFLLLSVVLLNIGILIQTTLNGNYPLFRGHLGAPAAIIVAFGALLSIMALIALLGVYCRSNRLLSVYIYSQIVFIVIELSLGIAAFLTRSHALRIIKESLLSAESKYASEGFASSTWNSIQQELKCCGVDHYVEWFKYFGNYSLPDSCCALYKVDCGRTALENGNFYDRDCISAIFKWAQENGISVAVLVTFIIIFQILSLFLSILIRFSSDD